MRHCQVSAYTASGDTTKTSIGSITLSSKAKKIVGIGCYAHGGAGMTTLEDISGIFELESSDLSIAPQQYPLEVVVLTGTGMAVVQPRVWPVDIPCGGGEILTGYVTMDITLAINPGCRWFVITEGN